MRKTTTFSLAAVFAALAAAALLLIPNLAAAQDDATPTEPPATDSEPDEGDEEREVEIAAHIRERLQALVDDEVIDSDQADRVAETLAEARPDRGRFGPGGPGRGPGHPGGKGHGHFGGGHGRAGVGMATDELADFLELEPEELRTTLRDGQTLAEIAEANGKTADDVVGLLTDRAAEHLTEAVEDGKLTQDEADEKLAEITERITTMVSEGRPGPRGPRS